MGIQSQSRLMRTSAHTGLRKVWKEETRTHLLLNVDLFPFGGVSAADRLIFLPEKHRKTPLKPATRNPSPQPCAFKMDRSPPPQPQPPRLMSTSLPPPAALLSPPNCCLAPRSRRRSCEQNYRKVRKVCGGRRERRSPYFP